VANAGKPLRINAAGTDIETGPIFSGTPFQMSINTANAGSASNQFVLPLNTSYTYDFWVDWGDGQAERWTTNTSPTHTYAASGTYTVSIWGNFPAIRFNNAGDRLKLLAISQWGTSVEWISWGNAFYGCANLTITATDSRVAQTHRLAAIPFAFAECSALSIFPLLDFSSVQVADSAFENCVLLTAFSFPLNWASCYRMVATFRGCVLLGALDLPNTANCISFASLAQGCTSLVSITIYNCGSAVDMSLLGSGCAALTALVNFRGVRSSIGLQNCGFNAAQLNNIFERLEPLLVSGSAVIAVTGCPGAATCTPSIAANKGWTVVQ
jgi:BspA type Leucine rich repeat region (6 copies)